MPSRLFEVFIKAILIEQRPKAGQLTGCKDVYDLYQHLWININPVRLIAVNTFDLVNTRLRIPSK